LEESINGRIHLFQSKISKEIRDGVPVKKADTSELKKIEELKKKQAEI